MAYKHLGALIVAQKKFSDCGRPTIVIVDLPTMEGPKRFFQKFTKWLIDTLKLTEIRKNILQKLADL